jgi:hypothetical protein
VVEISSAKLISHILVDFTSESDMELYISKFEKMADDFYNSLKKVGLIRWRFNRVWNKQGGYAISQIFEYRDELAYTKGQELLGKMMVDNQKFFHGMTIKRAATRAINIMDYYD